MADAMAMPTLLWALAMHRQRVLPAVRAQQAIWRGAASAIPDPELRRAALNALREKGGNAEATGVFALLAPRERRPAALRAMTALQTAVDYLDTLSEHPASSLEDALCLHRALPEAVSPGGEVSDWYARHRRDADGGYLAALVDACRGEVAALPAGDGVLAVLAGAAMRCGEGQSHTHAAAAGDVGQLEAWAKDLPSRPGYLWWELAAGASSGVAAHALIAAAADPAGDAALAAEIDAAYFPPVGALTVLLDDLVDREADAASGEHNYLAYCPDPRLAADRFGLLTERAAAAIAPLPHSRIHAAILAGVAGFYLSGPGAGDAYGRTIAGRMGEGLGPAVRVVTTAIRAGQLA